MQHLLSQFRFHPGRGAFALGTVALIHILFALSFLFILLLASSQVDAANATEEACRGANLLEAMESDAPAELADIRQQARAIPNGDSLLWRVDADGLAPSWLYGTMHVTDPRVLRMNEEAREAFSGADTVILESAELSDLAKAQASLMTNLELTMLTDGSTLDSLLDEDDYRRVEEALEERQVPIALVSRMKPWMVFSIIAAPNCELQRRGKGVPFLDKKLADDALAGGKELKGLETFAEQMSILTSLPMDLQLQLLVDTAALGATLDDMMSTMTELYLSEQLNLIMPLIEASAKEDGMDRSAYAEFEKNLVQTRNLTMSERLQPMLKSGNAFVAVGALHLPGNQGLVELLRDQGYTVTAVR